MTEGSMTEHKNPRENPIKEIIPKYMLIIYQATSFLTKCLRYVRRILLDGVN